MVCLPWLPWLRRRRRFCLTDLPDDILRHIADKLDAEGAARLQATSKGVCAAVREVVRHKVRHLGNAMLRDMARALGAGRMLLAGYQLGPRLGDKHRTEVPGFHIRMRDHVFGEHFLPADVADHPYRIILGRGCLDMTVSTMQLAGDMLVVLTFQLGNNTVGCTLRVRGCRLQAVDTRGHIIGAPGLRCAVESFERKLLRRVGHMV